MQVARYWDDEDDDQEQDNSAKSMRKQLEAMSAKLSERDAVIAELQKSNRQRTIADGLKDLGIPNVEKVARLIPSDVGDSPDKLKNWVEEYKDVFAPASVAQAAQAQPDEAATNVVEGLTAEQIQAYQRMQTADSSAGTTTPDMDSQQLSALVAARDAAGGSFDRYIAILRGEINP